MYLGTDGYLGSIRPYLVAARKWYSEADAGPVVEEGRLVEEHARSRGVEEPLVVGETRSTTLLVADPPTALAVTAEGASCAARAVLSDSVSCMLAARRVQADRFPDGVPGAGREPSASMETNAA